MKELYREWNSPRGRYTVSIEASEVALPLSVSNGTGTVSVRLLVFDIIRWKDRMVGLHKGHQTKGEPSDGK